MRNILARFSQTELYGIETTRHTSNLGWGAGGGGVWMAFASP